jgi:hypothetical protein
LITKWYAISGRVLLQSGETDSRNCTWAVFPQDIKGCLSVLRQEQAEDSVAFDRLRVSTV